MFGSDSYNSPKRLLSQTVLGKINEVRSYLVEANIPEEINQVIQHQLKSIDELRLSYFCSVCTKYHRPSTKCYFLRSVSRVLILKQPYCPFHEECIEVDKHKLLSHFAQNHFTTSLKEDSILSTIFCCCYLFPTNLPLLDCFASYLVLGRECPDFFATGDYLLIKSHFNTLLSDIFVDTHDFKTEIQTLRNYRPKYNPEDELLTRTNFWAIAIFLNQNFDTVKFNTNDIEVISNSSEETIKQELEILQAHPKETDQARFSSTYKLINVEWIRNAYTLQTYDTFRYHNKAEIEYMLFKEREKREHIASQNGDGSSLKRVDQEEGDVINKRQKVNSNTSTISLFTTTRAEEADELQTLSEDLIVVGENQIPDPVSDTQGMIKLREFLARKFMILRDGIQLDLSKTMCLFDERLDMSYQMLTFLIKTKIDIDNLTNFQLITNSGTTIKDNSIFVAPLNLNDLGTLMFMGYSKGSIVTSVFIGSCDQTSAQSKFRETIGKRAACKEVRFGAYSKTIGIISNFEIFTIFDEFSIISKYFQVNHDNFCSYFGRIKKYMKNTDPRGAARRTFAKLSPVRTKDEVKYAYQLRTLLETLFYNTS